MDENNYKFTGDELSEGDDSEYELDQNALGNVEITGVELDGVDLDGVELDEDELDGVELDGDELDGDELDGVELDGDELNEDELEEDELEEDNNSGKKSHAHASPEMVSYPPISHGKSRKKKAIQKWVWGMGALIMVLLMGIGGFFFIQNRWYDRATVPDFSTVKVAIPPKREIWLKDFLIPLRPEHLYTCVSFSVVIRSWDKAFLQRQPHEKQWLRGVLYDILLEKIQMEEETPSLDKFKEWMIQAVKHELPSSQIDTVDIQNFLVL